MLALMVLEGMGLIFAMSPSAWFDGAIPEAMASPDTPLGWLHLGKVPVLVLLGLFLAGFALTGYGIQAVARALSGSVLPTALAALPAVFSALAFTRTTGGVLARLLPSEESSAVSEQSLVGKAGIVTQGIARQGNAAQAKVRDVHGRSHYVMVEPDLGDQQFAEGQAVLLVKKAGARYFAIANPHPNLL